MSNNPHTSTADRIAMLVGGGLIILGTIVLGFVNTITNSPHLEVVEEGVVTAEPLVPPDIRAYLILLGLLIWGGFALFKLVTVPGGQTTAKAATAQ